MNVFSKVTILVLVFFISSTCSKGQTIFIGWGPVHSHTKQTEKLVNGKDAFNYGYTQKLIGIEYPIKGFGVLFSVSKYPVSTLIRVNADYYSGFTGSNVTRFDIGISYNLIKENKRLFIKPFFAAGLQYSHYLGELWGEQVRIFGPDYFQTEYPTSRGWSNFQVVPGLGVKMGMKFLKRMEAGICIQGVYGYKRFQELTFKYTYKDDPNTQRVAKFESNGTGLYSSFFLGINLKKSKKQ